MRKSSKYMDIWDETEEAIATLERKDEDVC